MRRAARLLLGSVTAVGILILFVFPARTLLSQDHQIAAIHHEISTLQQENATLRTRSADLQDPERVEQIARAQYGMVLPGQQAYAIQPAPSAAAPSAAPGPSAARPATHRAAGHWWRPLEVWRDL